MEKVITKFLRYVAFDTASDPESQSQPSTNKQFALLDTLKNELEGMGVKEVSLDDNGYLMASISSNTSKKIPAIGFISHVDTSPDASGSDINPQIIENYDGEDITLNAEKGLYLKTKDYPELKNYKGDTLITTDGTTLLGADDKAGIAEIMAAAEYLMEHPEIEHGDIKIGFTPDEEIGNGVDFFDVKKFGADFAYTMDGGEIGELEYENFNAAAAKIHIQGLNIHPGSAKNKMMNAILIASELNDLLPVNQRPEYTEGYEGFFHIISFKGTVEEATIQYIIRDHITEKFEEKKALIKKCIEFINYKYGNGVATMDIKDQYYNMRKQIEPHYHTIKTAIKAMEMLDITPKIQPIRGGTDGARLSYMGLPCPNIFAGGHNFHGKLEYVPVNSMNKAKEVILNIIKLYAQEN
ncbi:MAG: peptidase T [Bacteroidales bacterium]